MKRKIATQHRTLPSLCSRLQEDKRETCRIQELIIITHSCFAVWQPEQKQETNAGMAAGKETGLYDTEKVTIFVLFEWPPSSEVTHYYHTNSLITSQLMTGSVLIAQTQLSILRTPLNTVQRRKRLSVLITHKSQQNPFTKEKNNSRITFKMYYQTLLCSLLIISVDKELDYFFPRF